MKETYEHIQKEIRKSLEDNFLRKVNTQQTKYVIQSHMSGLIQDFVAKGFIQTNNIPIADVNNEKEIEYIEERISELELQRTKEGDLDYNDPIDHELWKLYIKHNSLKQKNKDRDHTTIDVDLKYPVTFEKWVLK